jgi:hypothetical protein
MNPLRLKGDGGTGCFRSDPDFLDMIITDLMPEMTCDELIRKIYDTRSSIPVMILFKA